MSPDPSHDLGREVAERLLRDGQDVSPVTVAAAVRSSGRVLSASGVLEVAGHLRQQLTGSGRLHPLLAAEGVTDVLVNAADEVWVDRGGGLRREQVDLGDENALRALAVRLAASAGARLDDASPWVDARLPDGVRLHAVLPPVAPRGTHLSLRVSCSASRRLGHLVAAGSLPPGWADLLVAVVRSRVSFLVSGGTGAGKTTVLSALLGEADPADRLVLVEDVGELAPDLPHVVRLEARRPNAEGRGEVSLADLVRQALRMRPDRLVVGECRGAEVRDLLAALNTGHEGGAGTVHANSAADVPARLEALGALAGWDAAAVHAQAGSALGCLVHVDRDGPRRRVEEVAVVGRTADGRLDVVSALTRDGAGRPATGPGWPDLAHRAGWSGEPP